MKKKKIFSRLRNNLLVGGLAGILSVLPLETKADKISVGVGNDSGYPGASFMSIRNRPEGQLGYDSGDSTAWGEMPPESPDVWLRVWSDQWNVYYNTNIFPPLRIDNRPFDGPDANQPFPLRLDIQGTNSLPSRDLNESYVRLQMIEGPDVEQGRRYYKWEQTLLQGLKFQDGSTNKTGFIDWTQGGTWNLPQIVGTNGTITGVYSILTVTPIASIPPQLYTWTINKGLEQAIVVPGTTNWPAGARATNALQNPTIDLGHGRRAVYKAHSTTLTGGGP